ncbi:hypothetical protein [uncultured Mediterranea sp.]|uniref:hypothetical protein n=1 Tax=uncultured Mediterranea sp. TaxID=1926662 RepID=UPI0027D9326A|nr:hypothetical protein [uncultured Mediterranea sp.]
MNPKNDLPVTLDEIRALKEKALQDVRQQKKVVNATTRKLFAPLAPAANKDNVIMRAFHTGMAAFDGVMIGIRLIKKFQKAFRR